MFNTEKGNSLADSINLDRNLVSMCANVNSNEQLKDTPVEPSSLTVNKEIYICPHVESERIGCFQQNDSPEWISCDDPAVSNGVYCQFLPENLFDIEVLDDQDSQISQFEGSVQGTTIDNLEPGTYIVNETKALGGVDQLYVDEFAETYCISAGFESGGYLFRSAGPIFYHICFEYEDEQGIDCRNITLAAGEQEKCTVKNYIVGGIVF